MWLVNFAMLYIQKTMSWIFDSNLINKKNKTIKVDKNPENVK